MRSSPQEGFSLAIRRIRACNCWGIAGRPGRDFRRQHAKAEATRGDKSKSDSEQVCWSEFRSNDVYRRVELPVEVDVDNVSAQYENGLLKVVAPKRKQPAKIVPIASAA
jgi:hypothetical protein